MPKSRQQTLGEEIANSISYGLGLIGAIVAIPILVITALRRGDAANVVGVSVFSATMVLLYLASILYHAMPPHKGKHIFRVFDHSAIYLLIAGTYTPFTLGILRGTWGWILFGLVWSFAVAGIALKFVKGISHPRLTVAIYLAMGWLALIAIKPILQQMPFTGFLWLVVGGLAYTVGVAFYAAHHIRYAHFIWHIFVIAGTTCHFFAVLWYAS
jgi:hemolysin III